MLTPAAGPERSLTRIAHLVKTDPEGYAAGPLRRFLWSLHDARYVLSLTVLTSRLDEQQRWWVADVMTAYLTGGLAPSDIRRALLVSGELERSRSVGASEETIAQLEDVGKNLARLARGIPPSDAHAKVAKLLANFTAVEADLLSAIPF